LIEAKNCKYFGSSKTIKNFVYIENWIGIFFCYIVNFSVVDIQTPLFPLCLIINSTGDGDDHSEQDDSINPFLISFVSSSFRISDFNFVNL